MYSHSLTKPNNKTEIWSILTKSFGSGFEMNVEFWNLLPPCRQAELLKTDMIKALTKKEEPKLLLWCLVLEKKDMQKPSITTNVWLFLFCHGFRCHAKKLFWKYFLTIFLTICLTLFLTLLLTLYLIWFLMLFITSFLTLFFTLFLTLFSIR